MADTRPKTGTSSRPLTMAAPPPQEVHDSIEAALRSITGPLADRDRFGHDDVSRPPLLS